MGLGILNDSLRRGMGMVCFPLLKVIFNLNKEEVVGTVPSPRHTILNRRMGTEALASLPLRINMLGLITPMDPGKDPKGTDNNKNSRTPLPRSHRNKRRGMGLLGLGHLWVQRGLVLGWMG